MSASRIGALVCASFMMAACSRPTAPAEQVKHYALHGQIVRLDSKDKLATIKHQKIGDWMGAMTMDFPVRDEKEFSQLREGETIDGTVFVQGMDYWVGEIRAGAAEEKK